VREKEIGYLGVGREEEERDGFMILDFGLGRGRRTSKGRGRARRGAL
jgi:hypothetical protein